MDDLPIVSKSFKLKYFVSPILMSFGHSTFHKMDSVQWSTVIKIIFAFWQEHCMKSCSLLHHFCRTSTTGFFSTRAYYYYSPASSPSYLTEIRKIFYYLLLRFFYDLFLIGFNFDLKIRRNRSFFAQIFSPSWFRPEPPRPSSPGPRPPDGIWRFYPPKIEIAFKLRFPSKDCSRDARLAMPSPISQK